MAKYLGRRRKRRRKAGQALWAPRCPCPGAGDTHIVVAISTTIMERGIHSPKQLTTDTTWEICKLGTLPLPPPPPQGLACLGWPWPPPVMPPTTPHPSSL